MWKYLAGCVLAMACAPRLAEAQPRCAKPVLPDTEVGGWYRSGSGNTIVGRARYRIASQDTNGNATATLGVALGHRSDDRSHAAVQPSIRELPDLMTASLQVRHELEDRAHPRGWDADTVEVLLDGKRFPGRLEVIGAPNGTSALVANWEVWYSEEDLLAAMENADRMEVRLQDTATASVNTFHFDVSSFRGIRAQLVPYWRCTATPYHAH